MIGLGYFMRCIQNAFLCGWVLCWIIHHGYREILLIMVQKEGIGGLHDWYGGVLWDISTIRVGFVGYFIRWNRTEALKEQSPGHRSGLEFRPNHISFLGRCPKLCTGRLSAWDVGSFIIVILKSFESWFRSCLICLWRTVYNHRKRSHPTDYVNDISWI